MDLNAVADFALFFPGFLLSLSVHEAAHGFVAWRFGDPTAKLAGRITINPIPHMDLIGTVILPALGFFMGGFVIGWGKPVPVDYRQLKNWRRDSLWIALAGPAANMILAVLVALILRAVLLWRPEVVVPDLHHEGFQIFQSGLRLMYLNLALAFFNLIPIHPLDGGKVLSGLLPLKLARQFDVFTARYGMMLLLVMFMTGIVRVLVGFPILLIGKLLLA